MKKRTLKHYCQIVGRSERQVYRLMISSALLLVFAVTLMVALEQYYRDSRENYLHQKELNHWLLQNHSRLSMAKNSYQKANDALFENANKHSLMRLVSETADKKNLVISRLEQRQSHVVVTLNRQSLSSIFEWLQKLNQTHSVGIEQASLRYSDANKASATFTLSR